MEKRDAEIMYEAVKGTIEEFLDEFVIIGRKPNGRRVLVSSTDSDYEMAKILKQANDWAHKRHEHAVEETE